MNRKIKWVLKLLAWTSVVAIPSWAFSTFVWDYKIFMNFSVVCLAELLIFWAGYWKLLWNKE